MNKFLSNILNPRFTIYKIASLFKIELPRTVASIIAFGNRPRGAFYVKTYDGSGQAVHPSVITVNGVLYMALTPYPYGSEWYENPCLYTKSNLDWLPMPGNFPIIKAEKMGMEHYSDPCLFVSEDGISLLFRKCERNTDGKEDFLFLMTSENGTTWTTPTLLIQGEGDTLISPAVAGDRLWCVESKDARTSLAVYQLNHHHLGPRKPAAVRMPKEWRIWHIDVRETQDGALQGVFMLKKNDTQRYMSKLALFTLKEDVWHYQHDISLPHEVQANIQFVYKSAFHPNGRDLICSARDLQGRYFLFEMNLSDSFDSEPAGDGMVSMLKEREFLSD